MTEARLKHAASLVTVCPGDCGSRPYIALEAIESGTGHLSRDGDLVARESPVTGAAAVDRGMVLFGKLRPYLAKVWLVDRPAYASTELLALDPTGDVEPRWFAYLCGSRPVIEWSIATSDGAKMPRTSWEKLRELRIRVPPLPAQRAIADFLDGETARIDALIAKKRRMVELLEERIDSIACGRLSSSSAQYPRLKLGQAVERLIDYRGATPEKTDSGVPLLTASNIVGGRVDLEISPQYISPALYAEWMRRGLPQKGDVILTTEAPLGEVAMIEDTHVALAQRLMLLRPRQRLVLPEYLYAYLRSSIGRSELLARASGSTVMGVRTDRLRDISVVVPPIAVQRLVIADLETATLRRRALGGRLNHQITLLLERRQTLITAAVTGEIAVTGPTP